MGSWKPVQNSVSRVTTSHFLRIETKRRKPVSIKYLSVATWEIKEFIAEQEIQGEKANNVQVGKGNDGVEICVSDEEHMGAGFAPGAGCVM